MQLNTNVRAARPNDVSAIVDVHLKSFPGFFLTFLGPRFLTVLYSKMMVLPEGISLVAVDDNNSIDGFVVGTLSQHSLYRKLLSEHWLQFAIASIGPAIRNFRSVPRLLRALRSPKQARSKSADCLLMSIAVLPTSQGKSLGRTLVQEFLDVADDRGADAVSLTTDQDNNAAANRFYTSLGFELENTFSTPEGRNMNEYLYEFSTEKLSSVCLTK